MTATDPRLQNAFQMLRRFTRQTAPAEHCELCHEGLRKDHEHLLDLSNRRLACVCGACAVLFASGTAHYRRVPRRIRQLAGFQMTDGQWDSLLIPIGMAFFFRSTQAGRMVAVYPSPAGPTESLLSLEAWDEIAEANPALGDLEPDVEALIVNRVARGITDSTHQYFLAPIDECYRLVGLIRVHWRGLSGGAKVWEEISAFFDELAGRSTSGVSALHA
jgi:hypothetical protein